MIKWWVMYLLWDRPDLALPLLATLTELQSRALELLNIDPARPGKPLTVNRIAYRFLLAASLKVWLGSSYPSQGSIGRLIIFTVNVCNGPGNSLVTELQLRR